MIDRKGRRTAEILFQTVGAAIMFALSLIKPESRYSDYIIGGWTGTEHATPVHQDVHLSEINAARRETAFHDWSKLDIRDGAIHYRLTDKMAQCRT
jgi:hypothetical protein